MGSFYIIWGLLGMQIFPVYIVPWIFYGWWLFTVTFFQHHAENLVLYGDKNWTFRRAALETMDRDYGDFINNTTHHITDCHVVHHLHFKSIPHYHLQEATKELRLNLKDGQYKKIKTHHFWYHIFIYYVKHWQFIHESQIH